MKQNKKRKQTFEKTSTNIVFHWWRAKPEKSGNITQNMALLFKIILTEYFYAKLLENAHYGLKLISNLRVYFTNGWRW